MLEFGVGVLVGGSVAAVAMWKYGPSVVVEVQSCEDAHLARLEVELGRLQGVEVENVRLA